jgi:hypothetical protein
MVGEPKTYFENYTAKKYFSKKQVYYPNFLTETRKIKLNYKVFSFSVRSVLKRKFKCMANLP